jgi:long-subunit acyl-CoA synthetase (AMP-forming)
LKKLASANGIKGESIEELVHDEKLNGLVLKEIQKAGREGGLAGIEIADGVVLAEEEWNPQNVSTRHEMHLPLADSAFPGLYHGGAEDSAEEDPSKVPERS